jgi:predicted dithiol-disulfide oxidoreductase (DUF899 family)
VPFGAFPGLGAEQVHDWREAHVISYLTYSAYARGVEIMMGFYPLLDRAPKGRNESDCEEFWIRRHDEY